jgi:prophage regulatory protein
MTTNSPSRVMRSRDACAYVGLSRPTIWRLVRLGRFPAPIQLSGPSSVGFLREEIDRWLEERAQTRPRQSTAAK